MTFFLLNNAQSQGVDGYSDDDLPQPELQAMFSGKVFRKYLTFFRKCYFLEKCQHCHVISEMKNPLNNIISGTIPIPRSLEETDEWMMFIDFGANDSGVDISGVKFESVNAVVVDQTTRFVTNTRLQCFKKILDF